MVIYADDFQTVNTLSDNTLELSWTQASSALVAKNFSNRLFSALDFVQKIKPNKLLANLSSLTYSGSPYYKEGFSTFILKLLKNSNVSKIALVKSNDSITQILTEAIFATNKINNGFEYKYFESEEEAYNWLYL